MGSMFLGHALDGLLLPYGDTHRDTLKREREGKHRNLRARTQQDRVISLSFITPTILSPSPFRFVGLGRFNKDLLYCLVVFFAGAASVEHFSNYYQNKT